jgi:hypothetical protein
MLTRNDAAKSRNPRRNGHHLGSDLLDSRYGRVVPARGELDASAMLLDRLNGRPSRCGLRDILGK